MATIVGHTTRANGTVLTATIYNADHVNHITNATSLNTAKIEGPTPPVVDGDVLVFDGTGGTAVRSGGGAAFIPDDGALPIADGGTGAITAAAAAEALGVGVTDSPQFAGVNIGTATPIATKQAAGDITPVLSVAGAASNSAASAFLGKFAASSSIHGLYMGASRNAAIGSHTVVQSGDALGRISFAGSDGTDFAEGARIVVEVDGTPGAGDMPGRMIFSTSADGAETPTERLRIDSAGAILAGGIDLRDKWNFVERGSAAAVASVDIDLTDSLYDLIRVYIRAVPVTDASATLVEFRLSNDGSTFLSGASDYSWASSTGSDDADDSISLDADLSGGMGNLTDEGFQAVVTIPFCKVSGINKYLHFHFAAKRSSGAPRQMSACGMLDANTSPLEALRVFLNTGNMATVNWMVEGRNIT